MTSGWTLPALFAILRDLKDLAFDVNTLPVRPLDGRANGLTRRVSRRTMRRSLWRVRRRLRGWLPRRLRRVLRIGEIGPLRFLLVGRISEIWTSASSPSESRRWGVYYVTGLIMKLYFRVSAPWFIFIFTLTHRASLHQVKRISLSKNILRAIDANPDIPPLSQYPRSHQVRQ